MDELRYRVKEENYDIVAVTESWATYAMMDAELNIDGYILYRKDKAVDERTKGGGVLLYIRDSLHSSPLSELTEHAFQDSVWCRVDTEDCGVVIGVCYRSTSSMQTNNGKLVELLERAAGYVAGTRLLVFGDFNYPEINYQTHEVEAGSSSDPKKFFDMVNNLFLFQNITECTRYRIGQQPSLLDCVFTDEDNVVDDVRYLAPLGKSDHVCLTMSYIQAQLRREGNQSKFDFWKGDYGEMKRDLQEIDWEKELERKGTNEAWTFFRGKLSATVEAHVPKKREHAVEGTRNKKDWMSKSTVKEIKRRNALWRKYRKYSSEMNYKAYKTVRNRVNSMVKEDKIRHQRKLVGQFRRNPKRFYGYMRRMQTVKDRVSGLKRDDGKQTASDRETADVFNSYFKSVFTQEGEWKDEGEYAQVADMQIKITEDVVRRRLKALKPDKSPGPDGMHPLVLKQLADELAKPLAKIFDKSYNSGEVPEDWRRANITPIYKKGARNEAGNYRPVSLTSIVCKVLEGIIKEEVMKFLEQGSRISSKQHGFMSGRSCLTNLLLAFEKWTEYLDEGYGVDVIYLDYRKAFDSVPHKRLMTKLKQMGVQGKIARWIEAFLADRSMRVGINGEFSSWETVSSGVPQGSVLGPLLFLIYVNDLPDWMETEMVMFADDTKVWNRISGPRDCVRLQQDLDRLQKWSDKWLLRFNLDKCKVMHMGRNVNFTYTLKQGTERQMLAETDEERDLGVAVRSNLSVSKQCIQAARKASRVLGMIRRQFKVLTKDSFLILYKSYVRPHLEYAIQAWSPYLRKDMECLERIQRAATRLVGGIKKDTYEIRLKKLKLTTLQDRRERGDMIEVYKILTGKEKVDPEIFFNKRKTGHNLRGHGHKLTKKRCRLEIRRNSFSQRVINVWNRLPEHVVQAGTVNSFKNGYDKERGAQQS